MREACAETPILSLHPTPDRDAVDAMPLNSQRLTLFQRDDCPLCDAAEEVLAAAHVPDFDPLWIDGDLGLEAVYGARVPVLRREDRGTELDWPFDAAAVRDFLR